MSRVFLLCAAIALIGCEKTSSAATLGHVTADSAHGRVAASLQASAHGRLDADARAGRRPRLVPQSVARAELDRHASLHRHRRHDRDQRARHRHEGRVRAELQAGEHGVRRRTRARPSKVPNLRALLDTLHAHNILRDRAHGGVQGFRDGARASRMDDPQGGRHARGATRRDSPG